MPVLVTARLTQSSSKVKLYQETSAWCHLGGSEAYKSVAVGGRNNVDTNNLLQLKGFEFSLKRKVAERYGGSYRDLRAVGRQRQSQHKSVQTLCTVSASDLSDKDRWVRRRPHSLDMSHSVVPCHRVIIREGSTARILYNDMLVWGSFIFPLQTPILKC